MNRLPTAYEIVRRQCDKKGKEIERLRKEKEWLLENWIIHRKERWLSIAEYKKRILKDMQQALKES